MATGGAAPTARTSTGVAGQQLAPATPQLQGKRMEMGYALPEALGPCVQSASQEASALEGSASEQLGLYPLYWILFPYASQQKIPSSLASCWLQEALTLHHYYVYFGEPASSTAR